MIFLCPYLHCKALKTAMYKCYMNSIIIIIIMIIIISFKVRLQYQSFDDNGGNSIIIQMCMLRSGSKLLSQTKVSKLILGIFCTFYGTLPKNKNYISGILGRMEIDFTFNSSP